MNFVKQHYTAVYHTMTVPNDKYCTNCNPLNNVRKDSTESCVSKKELIE